MGWSFLVSHKQDLQGVAIFLFYLLEPTTTLFRKHRIPFIPLLSMNSKGFSNLMARYGY